MNDRAKALLELESVREVASWASRDNFMSAFWKARLNFKSDKECFLYLNEKYFNLVGKDRYTWESFKVIKNL